ncbi:Flp pilus assembly complex ATPase component TadA [Halobaculum sp. CBA1158]|uniref:ATPase, T2SS/T4P/T4SS family n=1 Tax=Halobaculum sp. CBA1158 TaxID=2904243 RepID=UPI001F361C3C|nr:ATPase, T2SS/T4P/T4SS family [Halobaculum sp. CBA1158]UIO98511.1 Flp pilus assembly complex ATPase component TadA [Halobaculum sp. CBA1158]
MATDDAEVSPHAGPDESPGEETPSGDAAVVGEYTWDDFLAEHGHEDAAEALAERLRTEVVEEDEDGEEVVRIEVRAATVEDLDAVGVTDAVADALGIDPGDVSSVVGSAGALGESIAARSPLLAYDETPVWKDIYTWDDYREEYFLDENGDPPTDDEDEPLEFTDEDKAEALGFDPNRVEETLGHLASRTPELEAVIDERTVNVAEDVDEDAFFSDAAGTTTVANRYDLEKAVPMDKKPTFREEDRYWVNEPYSFVIVFHSTKENEKKYYVVEPYRNPIETDLVEFLEGKLRSAIKYADEGEVAGDEDHRRSVIREETYDLLDRYDLYANDGGPELGDKFADLLGIDAEGGGAAARLVRALGVAPRESDGEIEGIAARPEPAVLAEDPDTLTEYTVTKALYYLERDFVGYERIDGIKHDINVEDISCDGYNSPVFVYHSDYEQIITNVYHGEQELDDFVVKLAQRSGKGISKRRPQVDATLPDGSRAQLTLGKEVSDHGTNYTIRQFKDVPFTPIDLINWKTFSLDEMAFLWLCIENHKSLIFAGGTASGKTTSLNAVSLFIPSNSKIVSIEDTREVELPQRNWIASVTRPSFADDDGGDVDEFDLLEAALRQRPDYIVMGEIRGEEGRTLFQVMSTGHTTYTTFHADNVGEVLKRFTTEPINVSKTMFTALDLVSVQTQTRVQGRKVRRNKSLTEINHYDAENDEINVQDVYQWQAETDEFLKMGDSNTLQEIMFDRGWGVDRLNDELLKRRTVIAYLIDRGLNTYTQVAATLQAFINDPETILSLMANERLEESLEDLREMESVLIDVDPEKEEMVPRPEPDEAQLDEVEAILEEAEPLLSEFRGARTEGVADALGSVTPAGDVAAEPGDGDELSIDPEAVENADPSGNNTPANDTARAETADGLDAVGDDPVAGDGDAGRGDPDGDVFSAVDQFEDAAPDVDGDPEPDPDADSAPDTDIDTDEGADHGGDDGDAVGDVAAGDGERDTDGTGRTDGTESDPADDSVDEEVIDDWGFGEVESDGDDTAGAEEE